MVEVPVIKAFAHEGRALSVGDILEVTPIVAAALHYRGVVSLDRGYLASALEARDAKRDEPEPTPRRRRRYRRKDMVAEE